MYSPAKSHRTKTYTMKPHLLDTVGLRVIWVKASNFEWMAVGIGNTLGLYYRLYWH